MFANDRQERGRIAELERQLEQARRVAEEMVGRAEAAILAKEKTDAP